jgi:uncharacterized repeat protein (TIGR04076 family)
MKNLAIFVKKIKGNCPVYKIGDRIILDEGYRVNLSKTTAICMHSLVSILPYYVALSSEVDPKLLGISSLNNNDKNAYVQCLDPCNYTKGGTVIFEIRIF